ncbi:hypothetical protein C8Q74DRAFT_1220278 [Fomes fomentarius]|nr:hypothetical protein C8Q74DRAFT_1220278 [Fomes fomentarius]
MIVIADLYLSNLQTSWSSFTHVNVQLVISQFAISQLSPLQFSSAAPRTWPYGDGGRHRIRAYLFEAIPQKYSIRFGWWDFAGLGHDCTRAGVISPGADGITSPFSHPAAASAGAWFGISYPSHERASNRVRHCEGGITTRSRLPPGQVIRQRTYVGSWVSALDVRSRAYTVEDAELLLYSNAQQLPFPSLSASAPDPTPPGAAAPSTSASAKASAAVLRVLTSESMTQASLTPPEQRCIWYLSLPIPTPSTYSVYLIPPVLNHDSLLSHSMQLLLQRRGRLITMPLAYIPSLSRVPMSEPNVRLEEFGHCGREALTPSEPPNAKLGQGSCRSGCRTRSAEIVPRRSKNAFSGKQKAQRRCACSRKSAGHWQRGKNREEMPRLIIEPESQKQNKELGAVLDGSRGRREGCKERAERRPSLTGVSARNRIQKEVAESDEVDVLMTIKNGKARESDLWSSPLTLVYRSTAEDLALSLIGRFTNVDSSSIANRHPSSKPPRNTSGSIVAIADTASGDFDSGESVPCKGASEEQRRSSQVSTCRTSVSRGVQGEVLASSGRHVILRSCLPRSQLVRRASDSPVIVSSYEFHRGPPFSTACRHKSIHWVITTVAEEEEKTETEIRRLRRYTRVNVDAYSFPIEAYVADVDATARGCPALSSVVCRGQVICLLVQVGSRPEAGMR